MPPETPEQIAKRFDDALARLRAKVPSPPRAPQIKHEKHPGQLTIDP